MGVAVGLALAACGSTESTSTGAGEPSASPPPNDQPRTSSSLASPAPQDTVTSTTVLEPNATVLWIVDGDTIQVDVDGVETPVRLIGIDTPEKSGGFRDAECFGDEATVAMESLLAPGDEVFLERDEELYDRFDRALAYVHRPEDGLFVNEHLVLEGYAVAKRFPPNTFHAELLDAAQAAAEAANLGLWAACGGPDRPLAG